MNTYLADPDVRWLIGAIEEDGVLRFDEAARERETAWLRLPQLLARVQAALADTATTAAKRAAGPTTLAKLAAQPIEPAATATTPAKRARTRKAAASPTDGAPAKAARAAKPAATRRAK